ncbi:MAG: hypothetical protein V5A88_08060 [Candidatus Thermoplasmatota archaeon]
MKRELWNYWYPGMDPDLSLLYKDTELSENRPLRFYGVEEHSLLGLAKRGDNDPFSEGREKRVEDQKNVSYSRRWLEDNIGEDAETLVLNEFSRREEAEGDEVRLKNRKNGSIFRLIVSGEKVLDYRYGREGGDER